MRLFTDRYFKANPSKFSKTNTRKLREISKMLAEEKDNIVSARSAASPSSYTAGGKFAASRGKNIVAVFPVHNISREHSLESMEDPGQLMSNFRCGGSSWHNTVVSFMLRHMKHDRVLPPIWKYGWPRTMGWTKVKINKDTWCYKPFHIPITGRRRKVYNSLPSILKRNYRALATMEDMEDKDRYDMAMHKLYKEGVKYNSLLSSSRGYVNSRGSRLTPYANYSGPTLSLPVNWLVYARSPAAGRANRIHINRQNE